MLLCRNSAILILTLSLLFTTSLHSNDEIRVRRGSSTRLVADAAWQSRGIGGGGALYSATMSPFDVQEIYIATDMSSVFHTGNFGQKWEMLHFANLQGGIESQVRFTSDAMILYAINLADDRRVPVKSLDGGLTWDPLIGDPTSGEAYSLNTDPSSTQRVLVSDYSNLYYSSDGGASFSLVYSSSDFHIGGVFFDGVNIYVGAREGLLVSTNSGVSFSPAGVSGIPAGEAIVSFTGAEVGADLRFYAVTLASGDVYPLVTGSEMWGFQGIYRLDWGQASWTEVNNGIPSDARPFFVSMAANDLNTVYVAGGDTDTFHPIVYKTTNGGANWISVLQTVGNSNVATGWSGSGGDFDWWYGEYALGFSVSPVNADRAIITDLGYAHVTDDGGLTWRQAYVNPSDQNPAGSSTPKGEIYRGIGLEDTSVWWLHWADTDTIFAAFTDIRGMRSTDRGVSWQAGSSLGLPHNTTYHVVEHPTTGTLYAATSSVHDLYESTYLADSRIDGGDGGVVYSADDGASWDELHDFGHPVIWLELDPNDSDTLYASVVHSSAGGIFVTTNLSAGINATWTRLALPPRTGGHPFNIQVLDDGSLVATYSGRRDSGGAFTESSGVFLSSDSGASWLDRSHSNMMRWSKDVVIDPFDATQNTWYVTVFSHWGASPNEVGGLYRTVDRGLSWDRISDSYRVESCAVHPDDSSVLFFSTETEGLWMTTNLSDPTPVFERVDNYPVRQPVRIFFDPSDHSRIWVTSFGGGLHVSSSMIFGDGFELGNASSWSSSTPSGL